MIITVSLVNVLPNILTEFFSCIDNFEGLLSWQPGFSGGRVVKNLPANAGDARNVGLFPGSGRPPGGGNGNPLQYSCLENSMDRGTWRATVHEVAKSWTRLSTQDTLQPSIMQYNIVHYSGQIVYYIPINYFITGSL